MGRYNRSTRQEASIRRYTKMTLPRSVIGALVVGFSVALTGCIGAMQAAAHVGTDGLKSTWRSS